ncbi:MAG: aldose 1-epimerase family protein [Verrucomicrobiota bacterium]|nr:aldose 1-epimerase family protein [Verrucomicrobiota bacterium]
MKKTIPFLALLGLWSVSCDSEKAARKTSSPSSANAIAAENVNFLDRSSSPSHKDKSFPGPWAVSKTRLSGGKQEGVELLTLDNGKLKIVVIPSRGMGILEVTMDELRLGWDSPVKEVVHPSFIDLESRGGLGWLEGFNEWMVRCGLEFAGHPGTDEFINNTGGKSTLDLTLHGKIQNIPASSYEVVVDPEPPHRIRIRGTVYESFFYGPKLKLITEISTLPGSSTFRISDQLVNEGPSSQEFQLIYHGNYGSSILEEGSRVYAPAHSVTPMNDHAAKFLENWPTYRGPTESFIEEVFLIEPLGNENAEALAVLTNKTQDLATSVRWNLNELPYLTVWKNTAARKDGYVTGIEPATGFPFNRLVERKYGRDPKLAPGEIRNITLDFGIHLGKEEVDPLIAESTELQTQATIELIPTPPATE